MLWWNLQKNNLINILTFKLANLKNHTYDFFKNIGMKNNPVIMFRTANSPTLIMVALMQEPFIYLKEESY